MKLIMLHGIGNAEATPDEMQRNWIDWLVAGGADRDRLEASDPVLAYYADILSDGRTITAPGQLPTSDPVKAEQLVKAGIEIQVAAAQALRRELIARIRNPLDPAEDVMEKAFTAQAAAGQAGPVDLIDEVYDYLTKPGLRSAIDTRVMAAFDDDTPVILAHSLGSVVAWRIQQARARAGLPAAARLITIGSPLSFKLVRDRLGQPYAYPGGVRDWWNFYDPFFDPIALGREFPLPPGGKGKVHHRTVSNDSGFDHLVDGYLRRAKVAKAVMEVL